MQRAKIKLPCLISYCWRSWRSSGVLLGSPPISRASLGTRYPDTSVSNSRIICRASSSLTIKCAAPCTLSSHRHSYQQLRPLQRPSSGPRNSDHAVFYRSFVRRSYFLSPSCPDPYFFYPYRCCRHLFCIPPSVCHGP